MSDLTWYAVHTNSRAEWMVYRLLRSLGFEVLYLHFQDTVKHARREIAVLRPYFPRYLFVGVEDPGQIYGINRTLGVSTVVYDADGPLEIPSRVIGELRSRGEPATEDHSGLIRIHMTKAERERWKAGQRVRITDGPLTGLFGMVELDNGREVTVWLGMFRGAVRGSFEPKALSPDLRSYR